MSTFFYLISSLDCSFIPCFFILRYANKHALLSYIFPYTRRKQKGVVCERETDLETDRQAVGFNDKEAERKRERKRERERQTDRQTDR